GSPAFPVSVTSPSSARMDVVVTATLNYETSLHDEGFVEVDLLKGGNPRGPALAPGSFPIESPFPRVRTSTALQWGRRRVSAGGQRYTFELTVSAHDRNGDGAANVTGS